MTAAEKEFKHIEAIICLMTKESDGSLRFSTVAAVVGLPSGAVPLWQR
jgi:hypothetical protein